MARRFLTPIDMVKNELRNARVQNLANAPSNPVEGQIYFDTTTRAFRFYDGVEWVDVVSQEGLISQVNVENPITSTGGSSPTIGIHDASPTQDGAMSALDKSKLDGVADGATANDTDAALRDRSTHTGTQDINTVSGLQLELDGKSDTGHGHAIADTDGLQLALDGKSDTGHGHAVGDVTGLQLELDGKSDTGHGHAVSDVTGLQAELDAKAAAVHGHAISDTTGLQGELDSKQSTSEKGAAGGYAPLGADNLVPDIHLPPIDSNAATLEGQTGDYYLARGNHTGTQGMGTIDGLSGALNAKADQADVGAPGGIASLDGSGFIPAGQIPSLAITETFVVGSEAAMLGLDAQTGDVAIRTDIDTTFILEANDPSVLANWVQILTPDAGVQSVSGGTGIDSSGGVNPSISITAGGVGTTELADDGVTEDKLEPAVRDKINAPQGALKHAESIGDGTSTVFTVTHNMGTRDVQVQVFQTATPYAQVETDVELTTANEATIRFAVAPSSGAYRVVVVG